MRAPSGRVPGASPGGCLNAQNLRIDFCAGPKRLPQCYEYETLIFMSKRLQVVMDDREYARAQRAARGERCSLGEWVRRTIRRSVAETPARTAAAKLQALDRVVESAGRFPEVDIQKMLAELESGYLRD